MALPKIDDANMTKNLIVLDEHGSEIALTELYRERRILLVFLRHFGCRFCRQQVTMLKAVRPRLQQHGVECVLVSLGTSDQIASFKEEHDWDGEVYVDPRPDSPLVYSSFRLRRGADVLNNPETAAKAEEALADGFIDGGYPTPAGDPYTGDVKHVGGVFVLGAGNTCDYAFRSSHAGDHPDPSAIIQAVTGEHSDMVHPATASWIESLQSDKRAAAPALPAHPLSPYIAAATALLVALIGLADRWRGWQAWHTAVSHPEWSAIALLFSLATVAFLLPKRTAPAGAAASPPLPTASRVPLLSPAQIDSLSVQRNLLQCDCTRITTGTDLSSDWRVVQSEQPDDFGDAVHQIETLSLLDALTTLTADAKPTRPRAISVEERSQVVPGGSSARVDVSLHQMRLTLCYFREFLSKPHPLLGRSGPTCPFVPKALKLDCMRVGVVPTGAAPQHQQMQELVRGFIPIFDQLEPTSGPTAVFKAIVLLFPDLPLASAPDLIDGTQAALKEAFVERGLMLGEFHLLNNASGLHNANFFPLRTACPALAIRHMVPSDLVFLSGEQYPPSKRAAFLSSYIEKMSGQKGQKAQADVERAQAMLDELQQKEL